MEKIGEIINFTTIFQMYPHHQDQCGSAAGVIGGGGERLTERPRATLPEMAIELPLALPGSFTASIEVRKKLAFSKASIFLKKKL
jgi:hypothetical protein